MIERKRDWDELLLGDTDYSDVEAQIEDYRREIQAHCYRMMGSLLEAEDMTQEALLRAWRRWDTFEGRSSLRAWLYKIATNVCLDALRKRSRRYVPATRESVSDAADPIPAPVMEMVWLEPYPDNLLKLNKQGEQQDPESLLVAREHITLAFIAALQLLPPRQRAILILRDVLEWQANEVADFLDTSVSAVKSALHRARSTMSKNDFTPPPEVDEVIHQETRKLLEDYVQAWEAADMDKFISLLKDDATFSMPPIPSWYHGRDSIRALTGKTIFAGDAAGRWRLVATQANGQVAFGLYRQNDTQDGYDAYGVQVVTLRHGLITDMITFRNPAIIPYFGLPMTI